MLEPKLIRVLLILTGVAFLAAMIFLAVIQPAATRASLNTPPPRVPPGPTAPPTTAPQPGAGTQNGEEAPGGTIFGQVVDLSTGQPGRGLDVDINGQTVRTDSNGRYSLTGLAPGTYTITLHLPDGTTAGQSSGTIYLLEGQSSTLDLNYRSQPAPSPTPTPTSTPTPAPPPPPAEAAPAVTTFSPPSVVLSPLTAPTGDDPALWINPVHINNEVGVVGHIALDVANVVDFGAFQATLKFDPKIMRVDDVTLGNFLDSTGRQTIPLVTEVDNTSGEISFLAFTSGDMAGPDGGGTLAVVNFISKQAGTSGLELEGVRLVTRLGKTIDAQVGNAQLHVTACFGDLNDDGLIDVADLQAVAGRTGQAAGDPNFVMEFDLNNDGVIGGEDVTLVTERLNESCP